MKRILLISFTLLLCYSAFGSSWPFTGPNTICRNATETFYSDEAGHTVSRYIVVMDLDRNVITAGGSTFTLDYSNNTYPTIRNNGLTGTYIIQRNFRYCVTKVLGVCTNYSWVADEMEVFFAYEFDDTRFITDLSAGVCSDDVTTVNLHWDERSNGHSYQQLLIKYGSESGGFHDEGISEINNSSYRVAWRDDYDGVATLNMYLSPNECWYHHSYTQTVDVTSVLSKPTTPTGSTTVCQGQSSVNYNISSITGAQAYDWEILPTTAGTLSESSNNCRVNFASGFYGTARIRVRARNCGWSDWSEYRTITVTQLPARATTPNGQTVVCQASQSVPYTTSATRATSYTYSISPFNAGTITVTGNTAYVDFANGFSGNATLYATGRNCGNGATSPGRTITVNPLPGATARPTGTTTACKGATGLTYTTTGTTDATSYTWQLSPASAGTVTGTGTTGTVNFSSTFSGTATLRVRGESCNSGAWSSTISIVVADDLGTPVMPNGAVELCQDPSNTTYTIPSLSGATSYVWEISPTEAGLISGTSTTGTVDWNSSFSGSASVRVRGVNGCSSSPWSSSLTIALAPLPGTASIPTGSATVCQGTPLTNYSTTTLSDVTGYTWELLPTSAGSISGNGTTATVSWNSSYTGTASIRVRGINDCGSGTWSSSYHVSVNPLPGQADKPLGSILVCQGTSGVNYTSGGASFASSYHWELLPVEAGTLIENGTSATINFDSEFTGSATLKVRGRSCDFGDWSDELDITVSPLIGTPNMPTGEVEYCQDAPNSNFNVSSIANATSYIWELLPSSAGLISGNGNSSSVNWSSSYHGAATITVQGVNDCGMSQVSTPLNITVDPLPGVCGIPTGSASVCQGTHSSSYSTTGGTNSSSYEWELLPSTAGTISGTATIATVNWNGSFTGTASIRVRGVNDCGEGDWSSSYHVSINPLPGKATIPTGNSNACQGAFGVLYNTLGANFASSYDWELTPEEAGTLIENGTSATINFAEGFTGEASLKVRGISCGTGEWSDDFVITVIPNLLKPSTPVGEVEICQNSPNTSYKTLDYENATSFEWSILPSDAGIVINRGDSCSVNWSSSFVGDVTLNVRAYNTCGYSDWSDELSMNVTALPERISIPTGPSYLCQGGEVQLHVDSVENASSYRWEILPSNAFTFASDSTQNNVSIAINQEYTGRVYYKVYGENACGLGEVSQNIFLDVLESPAFPELSIDTVNCYGDEVNLFVTNNFGTYTTKWFDSEESLLHSGDNVTFTIDDNTNFIYVQYNGTNGCSSPMHKFSMNVPPKIVADFSTPVNSIKDGEAVTFVNESSGNATSYLWDFGDGFTSREESPVHSYFSTGTFDIMLTAYDEFNCLNSISKSDLISVSTSGGSLSIDNLKILGVGVYPNPSNGHFSIDTRDYSFDNDIQVEIYSTIGQLVYNNSQLEPGTIESIDLTNSTPGLYLINITVNGFISSKKLIIE